MLRREARLRSVCAASVTGEMTAAAAMLPPFSCTPCMDARSPCSTRGEGRCTRGDGGTAGRLSSASTGDAAPEEQLLL
jgi:hypothetical protein